MLRNQFLTASIAILFLAGAPALAQVRYTDNEGVTHWVDSLEQVPEQFRGGAIGKQDRRPRQQSGVDWEKRVRENEWAKSVEDCISSGQWEDPKFSAYVSGPGRVQMVGTARARHAFTGCMTEAGHQLK